MDNISIKDYIINNFKDDDISSLKRSINESIKEDDEVVLPGLGVLFSLIWNGSSEDNKEIMLQTLFQELNNYKK